MHTRREEGELEIEVLGGEHPLVVDGDGEGENVPKRGFGLATRRGAWWELGGAYHNRINNPLMAISLITFWSASFRSSFVISDSLATR